MEYYSAIKRKEILPFATTLVNLQDIVLNEISQRQKYKYCMSTHTYMWNLKKKSNSEKEGVEWWLPKAGGRGNRETLVTGYKLSVMRWISSGDLMNSLVTTVSNTVLYVYLNLVYLNLAKRVDLKCSHHTHTHTHYVRCWMCWLTWLW